MADTANSTERFGDRAGAYAAFRPGYPDALIETLLFGFDAPLVADVGAGTGISSSALTSHGARVIAIEPNASMRASAAADNRIEWREGTGHATGLDDNSVDIAACFQAFHWFADDAALAELARIARRRIAVIQYERDESDDFTRAYGDVVRKYATDATEQRRLEALEFFERRAGAPRRAFRSVERYTEAHLTGRAQSTSYLPQRGAAAEELHGELCALFRRFSIDGYVALAMSTFLVMKDLA